MLDPANPGYLLLGLGLAGLWTARRRRELWPVVALAGVTFLFALGPEVVVDGRATGIPGPQALLSAAFADNLRAPARWLAVTHAALGVLAAAVLAGRHWGWTAAVVAVALAELPRPEVAPLADTAPLPEVTRLLDGAAVPGPLLERFGPRCACAGAPRLRAALVHRRPLVGGDYARGFEALQMLNRLAAGWPRPETVTLLRGSGVRVVLEHPPLQAFAPPGWSCTVDGEHRLCVDEAPIDLGPVRTGAGTPVVGVRLSGTRRDTVTVTCGARTWTEDVRPWRVVAAARTGSPAVVDVRFATGCAEPFAAEAGEPLIPAAPPR